MAHRQTPQTSLSQWQTKLAQVGYFADSSLLMALHLATTLNKPLLLEGDPGVGKTELAKSVAQATGRALVRLQCYDGLDLRDALYEWNHAAQLIHLRIALAQDDQSTHQLEQQVYQPQYLIERPLLKALRAPEPGVVLLIDEVDRADEPFEAFLLEYLDEYQITIPEVGSVRALHPPITILTSNRTRDLSDAVRRRCFYQWLDYPDRERELQILESQVPELSDQLSQQVVTFIQKLRQLPSGQVLSRSPGIAESIQWAKALVALDTLQLDPEVIQTSAGILFKQREDIQNLEPMLSTLLEPDD